MSSRAASSRGGAGQTVCTKQWRRSSAAADQEENQTPPPTTACQNCRRPDAEPPPPTRPTAAAAADRRPDDRRAAAASLPTRRRRPPPTATPTHRPQEGKWNAVVNEIVERHGKAQPVLVGTISVEVSELLSERLKKRGVKHTVLNAKPEHAAREAETVAEAGQPGAVTIATNMAGRGVDIQLGGNPEHLARLQLAREGIDHGDEIYESRFQEILPALEEQVAEQREQVLAAGGLFICGTERHESRRIDNQLRGRAGRQGDPGESRFFLSAEDDLVRLFAGDRIYKVLNRLGVVDEDGNEQPIEAAMLSEQVEKAQQKVEEQNFLVRKRVLEYDDVMNEQRRVIYAYRDEVLAGEDISEETRQQTDAALERIVDEHTADEFSEDWDRSAFRIALSQMLPLSDDEWERLESIVTRDELADYVHELGEKRYAAREAELGEETTRNLERFLLLSIIDEHWQEHLRDMDYLRGGIGLRGLAQLDPLVAYKNEGFTLFGQLIETIWSDFTRMIFTVNVVVNEAPGAPAAPQSPVSSSTRPARLNYSGSASLTTTGVAAAAAAAGGAAEAAVAEPVVQQRTTSDDQRIGRSMIRAGAERQEVQKMPRRLSGEL